MFIYSILGVQLFTFVMRGDNLTDDRNLDTFGRGLLLPGDHRRRLVGADGGLHGRPGARLRSRGGQLRLVVALLRLLTFSSPPSW